MTDALNALRATRREAFAQNVLPCALEQGIRYGNCPACVLDGFLDPSDCLGAPPETSVSQPTELD